MKKIYWVIGLSFIACSHFSTLSTPYPLELSAKEGDVQTASIEIERETKFYEQTELSRTSTRKLRLKLNSKVSKVDARGSFWVENTTLQKEGDDQLNDLGFPELGEKLVMKLNSSGEVLAVKDKAKGTIFYLPPVLLPKTSVRVGEHWTRTYFWKSPGNPMRMKTEVHCTLKGQEIFWEREVLRVELETLSQVAEAHVQNIRFESRSQGYFLWDVKKARVIYSESQAKERLEFITEEHKMETVTKFISKDLDFDSAVGRKNSSLPPLRAIQKESK